MTKERRFIDGIESIAFVEGMVHVELFNYIAGSQKQKGKRPDLEVTEELILNPQGFLQAFSAMQNLVGQLEQAGVIKKNDANAKSTKAEIIDDKAGHSVSPNWSNN